MSTNCLVTKLKGIVENSNLPFIGETTLSFKAFYRSDPVGNAINGSLTLGVNSGILSFRDADGLLMAQDLVLDASLRRQYLDSCWLGYSEEPEVISGNVSTKNGKNLICLKHTDETTPKNYSIKVRQKYEIDGISIYSASEVDINGFIDLLSFGKVNIFTIKACSLTENCDIATIVEKAYSASATNLLNFVIEFTHQFYGNLNVLARFKNAVYLNVNGTNVEGSAEELFEGILGGRTSAESLHLMKGENSSKVTWNGGADPNRSLFAVYSNTAPYISVYKEEALSTLLGTFDGTSWTYSNQ